MTEVPKDRRCPKCRDYLTVIFSSGGTLRQPGAGLAGGIGETFQGNYIKEHLKCKNEDCDSDVLYKYIEAIG